MIKTAAGALSALALAAAAFAAPATAEEREFSWSMTVGGTSDYIFRGISFNSEDPAFQMSVDGSYGILYFGAWGSNIDGPGFEPWELDLYVGITPSLGPVTFDFAVLGYLYPSANNAQDYLELKAGASMELVKSLTGKVAYYRQIDNGDGIVDADTVEGGLAYALPAWGMFEPEISGLVGYSTVSSSDAAPFDKDYVYWNVGLALTVEKFTMDFRYWDTDISDSGFGNFFAAEGNADERFVFSAKVTVP